MHSTKLYHLAGRPFVSLTKPGPPRPLADLSPASTPVSPTPVQQQDIRQLTKMMLSKIHPPYISLMSEPVIRMAQRTIPWIKQDFLFERCGRLTPLEMMEEVQKHLDYFCYLDTQSLPEHFAKRVQAHNTALSNDTPFSERDKVAKVFSHVGFIPRRLQFPTI